MLNKVLCFVNTCECIPITTAASIVSLTDATIKSMPRYESRLLSPVSDRDDDHIYVYVSASNLCDSADQVGHVQHLGDVYLAAP